MAAVERLQVSIVPAFPELELVTVPSLSWKGGIVSPRFWWVAKIEALTR